MAIVQISKIQHRYGNLIDLPQLDNAELGYATDEKRLFIGTSQTGPEENVEVLTSYSEISFSQITGAGANLDVDTANLDQGQVIAYDGTNWVNAGGDAGGLITLGDVSNVKLTGGSAGFVLETDGTGNLNWSPKNVISAYINDITQANPGVVTTTEPNFFIDGSYVLITDVEGMTELNGNSYYTKILTSTTFELYSDYSLTVPLDTTSFTAYTGNGRAITSAGSGGGATAGGSNTNIQFNYNNILFGVPTFSYDFTTGLLNLTGNATVTGNINAGNLSVSGTLSSTGLANVNRLITTALPGTAPIQTVSTTKVANLNADLLDGYDTSSAASGSTVAVRDTNGNLYASWFVGDGSTLTNINGANVFGQVPNALVSATVYVNAQPNITSTGTLVSLSVSGNANIGNIGTGGLISAAGNITGANIFAIGNASVTGNVTANNFIGIIRPTAGTGSNGIIFPADPGGGSGDLATIQYYAAVGEQTVLSLNVTNDADDRIYLNATGGTNVATSLNITGPVTASGTITAGNLTVNGVSNVGPIGNLTITGGTSDDIITTNGSGVLSWTSRSNIYSNSNVASYLPTYYGTVGATVLTTGSNSTAGTITGAWTLTTGSTLQATYADLAEYYEADNQYEPGTVLEFGGEKEVTLATDGTTRVAGVVSTSPAYVMNAQCDGIAVPIALQGRVPVKVRGRICKGDMMVSAGEGFARPWNNPHLGTVIGKALENFEGVEGVIEIAVGRL